MYTGAGAAWYGSTTQVFIFGQHIYFDGWITTTVEDLAGMNGGDVVYNWLICLFVYRLIGQGAEKPLRGCCFPFAKKQCSKLFCKLNSSNCLRTDLGVACL